MTCRDLPRRIDSRPAILFVQYDVSKSVTSLSLSCNRCAPVSNRYPPISSVLQLPPKESDASKSTRSTSKFRPMKCVQSPAGPPPRMATFLRGFMTSANLNCTSVHENRRIKVFVIQKLSHSFVWWLFASPEPEDSLAAQLPELCFCAMNRWLELTT